MEVNEPFNLCTDRMWILSGAFSDGKRFRFTTESLGEGRSKEKALQLFACFALLNEDCDFSDL